MLGLAAIVLSLAFFTIVQGQIDIQAVTATAAQSSGLTQAATILNLLRNTAAESARENLAPREGLRPLVNSFAAEVSQDVAEAAHAFGYAAAVERAPSWEAAYHAAGSDAWSFDGARYFTLPPDGVDDGILWETPCPLAPIPGCAAGAFLVLTARITIDDGILEIYEPLLVAGPIS